MVGASRWYIRSPFIIEGGFYGAFGGMIAFIVIISLVLWARPALLTFLGVVPAMNALLSNPTGPVFVLSAAGFFAVLTVFGYLLGCIGSYSAVNRYLKM